MFGIEKRQRKTGTIRYAATDTSRTLIAAHGSATAIINVTRIMVTVVTSAAQALTIACGAVTYLVVPASAAAGAQYTIGPFPDGIPGVANTALLATSTAGPAFDIDFEGFYEGINQ